MQPISPKFVRFIKLGQKGLWESDCIEGTSPWIRLGFPNPHHADCLAGNWAVLRAYWAAKKTKGKATEITNQIRDFYTLGEDTMWITFYQRRLFWCFARPQVDILQDGTRSRRVIGSWSSESIKGEELLVENLSGRLTKTQGFRGTICTIGEQDYLVRRINGEVSGNRRPSDPATTGGSRHSENSAKRKLLQELLRNEQGIQPARWLSAEAQPSVVPGKTNSHLSLTRAGATVTADEPTVFYSSLSTAWPSLWAAQ
jgi:hypothetical protein